MIANALAVVLATVLAMGLLCASTSPTLAGAPLQTGAADAAGEVVNASDESRATVDVHKAVTIAERLIIAGHAQQALQLLQGAMQTARDADIDTTNIRFIAAQALLKLGRVPQAAALLGELAEELPHNNRVQLDYAAALFALGHDREARAIFRDVRQQDDLPPAVRRNVEDFLERMRARQRLRVDFDSGFWIDNNVNGAPEQETVQVPFFPFPLMTARPVRARIVRTGINLNWQNPVGDSGRVTMQTQASVARNTAKNASMYNRTWFSLSTGPRVPFMLGDKKRPAEFRSDIGLERRWRGGERESLSKWSGVGWEQALSRRWRTGTYVRYWRVTPENATAEEKPRGYSIAPYLTRRLGNGSLRATVSHVREKQQRKDLSWTQREARLGYAAGGLRGWNWSLRASYAVNAFDGVHPTFLVTRKDHNQSVELVLAHRSLARAGYLPQIRVGWSKTNSNISLFERQVVQWRFNLQRLF